MREEYTMHQETEYTISRGEGAEGGGENSRFVKRRKRIRFMRKRRIRLTRMKCMRHEEREYETHEEDAHSIHEKEQ